MRATVATLAICTVITLCFVGCINDSESGGTDLFQLAVDEAPGGALLSVWVSPEENVAFLAGGYVGVAPADAPDGALGRLVRYENGAFVTVCRVPSGGSGRDEYTLDGATFRATGAIRPNPGVGGGQ